MAAEMMIWNCPIEAIHLWPPNLKSAEESDLTFYLQNLDRLDPVSLLRKDKCGKHFILFDGYHRCAAAIRLGRTTIKARIGTESEVQHTVGRITRSKAAVRLP